MGELGSFIAPILHCIMCLPIYRAATPAAAPTITPATAPTGPPPRAPAAAPISAPAAPPSKAPIAASKARGAKTSAIWPNRSACSLF